MIALFIWAKMTYVAYSFVSKRKKKDIAIGPYKFTSVCAINRFKRPFARS